MFYPDSPDEITETDKPHIEFHIIFENQALVPSILRDIDDTIIDGILRSLNFQLFAVQINISARLLVCTEDCLHQLCSPGPHQTCKAYDLSVPCMEIDIPEILIMFQALNLQGGTFDFMLVSCIIAAQFAADHHLNQFVLIRLRRGNIPDHFAVTQNDNPIRDCKQLFQSV